MSGKTCSKCYYLLVASRRHKGCLSLSSKAEACKDFRGVSVFDMITASPEALAEETVYMDYNYDKQMCGFTTPFIDEMFLIEEQQGKDHEEKYFNARNEAIAATVARLKEVGE